MHILNTTTRSFCLLLLIFLSACGDSSPEVDVNVSKLEPLSLSGAGKLGIFNPSIARDPGTGRLWMSYSSHGVSTYYLPTSYGTISIRLAYSDDNGITWHDTSKILAPYSETLVGPMTETQPDASIPANSKGIWQSATSTLLYDPSAPETEQWKLVWSQFLNADLVSYVHNYGWLAMKQAASPMELATAPSVKLFGGYSLQPDNSNTNAPAYSPIGGAPEILLNVDLTQSSENASLAGLSTCGFSDPAMHATNDAIYLATICTDLAKPPEEQYLAYFRCSSPCNMTEASSWKYLGHLLSPNDFQGAFTKDIFYLPAFTQKEGKTYLLISVIDRNFAGHKGGCRVYEFEDINSNSLRRNNGQLIEIAQIIGDGGSGEGRCATVEGLEGGVLLSLQHYKETIQFFHIVKSQVLF